MARVLLAAAPVQPAFDEDEFIPDAADLDKQFWSQAFRRTVRDNTKLEPRLPGDVDWTTFQQVMQHLLDSGDAGEEAVVKTGKMIDFIYNFMKFMNTRLDERDDLYLLEACSLFDPAHRKENKLQRQQYMDRLLAAFPHDCPNDMHAASVVWLRSSGGSDDAARHFVAFAKGADSRMQTFGKWSLDVLKNIPSNAIVESRFSTVAQVYPPLPAHTHITHMAHTPHPFQQVKSANRMNLGEERTAGIVFMRDEADLRDVQFESLLEEMQAARTVFPEIRGTYSKHPK